MEKRISFYEFQSVKSVAKACDPLIKKRDRVKAQVEKLVEEYKGYDSQIKALEEGVVKVLGLGIEELVKKVTEPAANGLKVTKYLPTDRVKYDEAAKQFVITLDATAEPKKAEPAKKEEPVNEETAGEALDNGNPFE